MLELSHRLLLLLLVLWPLHGRLALAFSCGGGCSGHGVCEQLTGRCSCFPGYGGVTCVSRLCPTGAAWVDRAFAVDKAHVPAECSAMGRCDRATGLCACEAGFEGIACERLACPASCSGNGRCVSMREAAALQDDRNFFVSTTYALWDADKSVGCQCDPGFTGFDCSLRECPTGDDPLTTGQSNEVQLLTCACNSCTGSFALSFRGRVTSNLVGSSATPSDLKTALKALDNVYGVTATVGSGGVLCSSSNPVTSITFTNNPGDLPLLKVFSGGSTGLTVTMSSSADGTRENVYCSNHGTCDFGTGLCRCASGFASSDGAGAIGNLGDCGYQQSAAICPSTFSNGACDGKGTCSGGACTCNVPGYTGYDCTLRQCPKGAAWFDGASAPNTAHALAQCSNKGSCNTATGVCSCLPPFTGAACDMLRCPVGTVTAIGATCSGRGTCKTIQQLSFEATDTQGNPLGVTYGATPNTLAVWDATKIQGCDCMANDYFGPFENAFGDFGAYDCSMRACPRGADPFETGKLNEKQTLICTANGGEFTLTFRGETTAVIPYNAGAAQVQTTLEALDSVRTALVSFGAGSVVCNTSPVTTTVEFTFMQGDLPPLSRDISMLTLTSSTASLVIGELQKGTKANIECSARGTCDRTTGVCSCYAYFLSSDGAGNLGRRGDCGYVSPYPTVALS